MRRLEGEGVEREGEEREGEGARVEREGECGKKRREEKDRMRLKKGREEESDAWTKEAQSEVPSLCPIKDFYWTKIKRWWQLETPRTSVSVLFVHALQNPESWLRVRSEPDLGENWTFPGESCLLGLCPRRLLCHVLFVPIENISSILLMSPCFT